MANGTETKFIVVNTIKLAYREINSPATQTMVLLHGLAESSQFFWEPLLEEFRSNYRIIAFDLLGHGESEAARNGYEPDNQSKLFVEALDKLGINEFILVAHSLGGMVGLCIALEFPSKVKKLVLYSVPISRGFALTIKEMLRELSIFSILPGLIFLLPGTGRIVGLFPNPIRGLVFRMTFLQWHVPYQRKLLNTLFGTKMINEAKKTSGIGLEKTVRNTFLKHSLIQVLPKISTPILFIKGSNDFILSDAMAHRYVALFPNASLHKIDASSHISLLDKPTEFNNIVKKFLEELKG